MIPTLLADQILEQDLTVLTKIRPNIIGTYIVQHCQHFGFASRKKTIRATNAQAAIEQYVRDTLPAHVNLAEYHIQCELVKDEEIFR